MTSPIENLWGASDYAPTAHRLAPVAPVLAHVAAQAIPPPATALEIGAGHGHLATLLADHGYDVIAVEPTRRMREIGQLQTPDSVRWVDAAAEMTGLDDGSVDLVVSSFGLMFADPIAGIGEMARVLRPGGSLIMTAWAPGGFLHDMTTRMIAVLPHVANAPHLAWSRRGFAEDLLEECFEKITITERQLPWRFESVTDGMDLYRHGSPTHAATFAMAGERRADLENTLEQQLAERAGPDGSIDATTSYLMISGTRR